MVGGGVPKAATVLSVLLNVCTIPCNDRGQINVVLDFQRNTDFVQVMAGSSNETFPTPSDGTYSIGNINFEAEAEVIEEDLVAINKQLDTSIKQGRLAKETG
jgi:hypothetical protein